LRGLGGNVTGLAYPESLDELSGKWIELLSELVPKLSRLAVFTNADNPSHGQRLKDIEAAGRRLRVDVSSVEMRQLDLGFLPAGGLVRRQDSQGCQARRPSDRAADDVRTGHQRKNRQGARPHDSAVAAAPRGPGPRMMQANTATTTFAPASARERSAEDPLAALLV
jgi:hypothetical protein